MKKLQNVAAFLFIICVVVLSVVSILGVWDIFGSDVITKSFQTLGLLAGVSVIIMIAGRFTDSHHEALQANALGTLEPAVVPEINPAFTKIRYATVATLVTSIGILALLGVLSIWEVMEGTVLTKSVSSIGIAAFASFIIVVTCLEREHHKILQQKFSGGAILLLILIGWILLVSLY